jgi:hypothetical protein
MESNTQIGQQMVTALTQCRALVASQQEMMSQIFSLDLALLVKPVQEKRLTNFPRKVNCNFMNLSETDDKQNEEAKMHHIPSKDYPERESL